MRPRLLALVVGAIAPGTLALADPPQIGTTSPIGVRRGVETEITISGANLAGTPTLLAPFAAKAEHISSDGGNWKLKLTVPAEVTCGSYPVRVQTEGGISNPHLLPVGDLPQVGEVEPNNTFAEAKPVAIPAVLEGSCAGTDVDYFKFAGKKDQRIVVDAQCARIGSGVDPQIRLTTAAHKFVASADDTPGLFTDARLIATLPEDGEYVLEFSDTKYQGGGKPFYRISIDDLATVDEVFPLGGRRGESVAFELRGGTVGAGPRLIAQAVAPAPTADSFLLQVPAAPGRDALINAPLVASDLPEVREPADPAAPPIAVASPVAINGRIESAGDQDKFLVAVKPGQTYHFEVQAADLGSQLDGQLQILKADGAALASGDDYTVPPEGRGRRPGGLQVLDPVADLAIPADVQEVQVVISDTQGRGGVGFPYRLTITPVTPTFELRTNESQVSIPKGGNALVPVSLVRLGYNGPVELTVLDPPSGLVVRPGTIADGQGVGVLSLSATQDAAFGAVPLKVVGKGANGLVVQAARLNVFSTIGALPAKAVHQTGLLAAPATPEVITFEAPAGPIEVPHGGSIPIPIKAIRTPEAKGELTITALPLAPGLAVPEFKLGAEAAEGAVAVAANPPIPGGPSTIGLVAKGKIGGRDQTFALPAVTVSVVTPFALTLAAPSGEIKPGQSLEVKGKVERKAGFGLPVTVRIDGLPAGTKAEPVTVAPDKAEFAIKVDAEAGAAAAQAKANVVVAVKINNQDYPTPPAPFELKVAP